MYHCQNCGKPVTDVEGDGFCLACCFIEPDEFRSHYAPDESPDLPYQAQWLYHATQNADGYERGGWYASEQEAIEGAKRGKLWDEWVQEMMDNQ